MSGDVTAESITYNATDEGQASNVTEESSIVTIPDKWFHIFTIASATLAVLEFTCTTVFLFCKKLFQRENPIHPDV